MKLLKLIVTVTLALGVTGSAWAVQAPQRERTSSVRQDLRVGGLRRPTTDFSHLRSALLAKAARRTPSKFLKTAPSIPSRWDSREQGWVTPIKNQGSYGTCWAFATMASLETAYLKDFNGTVTNDFSENHLASHDVGFGFGFDGGGNNQIAAALLTSWRDPILESEDPYPHPDSKVNVPPQCHVQNIVWLPERFCSGFNTVSNYVVDAHEDNREVDAAYKRAIMTYGAVSVGYYHAWNHYNRQTAAHCFQYATYSANAGDGGHAVTLIGWDDDYPAENFVSGRRPKGNGAFLVKNSWGTSSGTTNGCTWISYYDEAINHMPGAAYPLPGRRDNYGRVYEYDPCGQISAWNVCDTDAEQVSGNVTNWCANVFTAVATGVVEAVGFYALSADTAYTLRVYRNCAFSPSDGELMSEQRGTVAESGYVTVPLALPVPIEAAGTKFSVVLQLTCPGYDYPLPAECTHYELDEDGNLTLWCACTANAGESFMSKNGRDWRDFQDYDPTGNFCVKAYTRYGSDGEAIKLIVSSSPEADAVSARVGDSQTFAVTAEAASEGEEISYVWRVNGVSADCPAAEFVFTPTFAQRGNCAVECLVRSGAVVDVRKWTVSVNADLHVRADSEAADPDGSPEHPFAAISDACIAAIAGDTVLVGPGVYYGTLEGPSVQIEIRSASGPDETVLDAEGNGRCFLAVQNGNVALSGFTLRNADAAGYRGGGAYGGVITNCVISNCVASAGGGAYGAELRNCRITGCMAGYYGGGLCDSTAEGCVIFGNVAYESGGGAGGERSGCELSHCTVFGNQSYSGGGVEYSVLANCLVVGNRAESYQSYWQRGGGLGGGVLDCDLFNCTVAANSAAVAGGGMFQDSAFAVCNTVVSGNSCDAGPANGNDAYGLENCTVACSASGADARFADAAHDDFSLSANSPCIDAGSNAFVTVDHDLDGEKRIFGPRVDMGCYEYRHQADGWPAPAVESGDSAESEAEKVGRAMTDAGFPAATASHVTTLAQYHALSGWAESKTVDRSKMTCSSTALVSAALWADGLLDLDEADVKVGGFVASGDGWKFCLDLEAYDPGRVNAALLKAAVGAVGSDTPTGGFSSDGLGVKVSPGAEFIEVSVTPPSGKSSYYLKGSVR